MIYGLHAVKAALVSLEPTKHNTDSQNTLFWDKSRQDPRLRAIIKLAKEKGLKQQPMSKAQLEQMLSSSIGQAVKHQGVALVLEQAAASQSSVKSESFLDDLLQQINHPPLLLILDGVQDPHNLGACLRSADGAGVDAVIIPKDRAVSLTPVVRKVACGADQNIPLIQVTNLARTLKRLKTYDIWLVGTAGEAKESVYQANLTGGLGILMGAEEKGLRRLTRENCDVLIHIPMQGQVESLNVSVATGVVLYEALRQRKAY